MGRVAKPLTNRLEGCVVGAASGCMQRATCPALAPQNSVAIIAITKLGPAYLLRNLPTFAIVHGASPQQR